jgi:hypothetical protein
MRRQGTQGSISSSSLSAGNSAERRGKVVNLKNLNPRKSLHRVILNKRTKFEWEQV